MKNEYKIKDNVVVIILEDRKGIVRTTSISLEDFDKANIREGTYFASYRKNVDNYYACITTYLGYIDGKPKYRTEYLHRIIMGANNRKILVDHIDFNTLNNLNTNLRISNAKGNCSNRSRINSNNKTGVRNICQVGDKLVIQLQINGKNKVIGRFELDELDIATEIVEKMRKDNYGEFSGK